MNAPKLKWDDGVEWMSTAKAGRLRLSVTLEDFAGTDCPLESIERSWHWSVSVKFGPVDILLGEGRIESFSPAMDPTIRVQSKIAAEECAAFRYLRGATPLVGYLQGPRRKS